MPDKIFELIELETQRQNQGIELIASENYGLYVERTDNVNFYNNIVYGTPNTKLFSNSYNSNVNAGNNCWYGGEGSKPSIDLTGIFTDPLFINNDLTAFGDYKVISTSPCVDAGSNASTSYVGSLDLNGNKRTCRTIDIGAFEFQVADDIDGTVNTFLGNLPIKGFYLGTISVQALYLGDTLVYKT